MKLALSIPIDWSKYSTLIVTCTILSHQQTWLKLRRFLSSTWSGPAPSFHPIWTGSMGVNQHWTSGSTTGRTRFPTWRCSRRKRRNLERRRWLRKWSNKFNLVWFKKLAYSPQAIICPTCLKSTVRRVWKSRQVDLYQLTLIGQVSDWRIRLRVGIRTSTARSSVSRPLAMSRSRMTWPLNSVRRTSSYLLHRAVAISTKS